MSVNLMISARDIVMIPTDATISVMMTVVVMV